MASSFTDSINQKWLDAQESIYIQAQPDPAPYMQRLSPWSGLFNLLSESTRYTMGLAGDSSGWSVIVILLSSAYRAHPSFRAGANLAAAKSKFYFRKIPIRAKTFF